MTDPDLPDSGMASGSDAGQPGEHLGTGELRPDEERLLAELERGVDRAPQDNDAEVRAAEDEAPLPADGGAQGDGLEAGFSDPATG
ncbi:hypothetical protein [Geodermatophilus sp. SYSU D01119]